MPGGPNRKNQLTLGQLEAVSRFIEAGLLMGLLSKGDKDYHILLRAVEHFRQELRVRCKEKR